VPGRCVPVNGALDREEQPRCTLNLIDEDWTPHACDEALRVGKRSLARCTNIEAELFSWVI